MKRVGGVESVAGGQVRQPRTPIDACRAGGKEICLISLIPLIVVYR